MSRYGSHLPQGAQFIGALLVSGGFGVLLGWAIGCIIVGCALLAGGTLAERARMTGKG